MALEKIFRIDDPENKERRALRCNLGILPASADREIGNVGFDRRAEDSASDHKTLIHRHDCRFLGNMLQGVADCGG
jgi:hypothetical protein